MYLNAAVFNNNQLIQTVPEFVIRKIVLLASLALLCSVSWGSCVGNCLNGKGTYTFPDESMYIGQWMYGKFNGQGTFIWPGKGKYIGKWRDGESRGEGIIIFSDGRRYTGQFSKNYITGLKALDPSLARSTDTQDLSGKTLFAWIQQQLIDYGYLDGTADAVAGKKTSHALAEFYRDTQITAPEINDYRAIVSDLKLKLLSANGTCSYSSAGTDSFTVCFTIGTVDASPKAN